MHASDLADRFDDAHLVILHVNALHKGGSITAAELRRAVEDDVGPLADASYQVCDSFLIEKAILHEAAQQNADYVVIGRSMRANWLQRLAHRLGVGIDLEAYLDQHLNAELVVIQDPERASSRLAPFRHWIGHFRGR